MEGTVTPATIDAIVAGMVLEFVGLALLLVRAQAGALAAPLFLHLASGACLLLALRAALATPDTPWIGVALLASLAAHVGSLLGVQRVLRLGGGAARLANVRETEV